MPRKSGPTEGRERLKKIRPRAEKPRPAPTNVRKTSVSKLSLTAEIMTAEHLDFGEARVCATLKKMNRDVRARLGIGALIFLFAFETSAAPLRAWSTSTTKSRAPVSFTPVDSSPYFDIPVTYNTKVKWWINYFQTTGRKWFRTWLERSHAYMPQMQTVLRERGMPQDLAFVAMIESGFSPQAISNADAVGYWQFIAPTARRYGLKTTWWLDERRDFTKSTTAASKYLADLFRQFGSWYLTAAAYNMGEGRMQKLVTRYGSKNYWILSKHADFPDETRQYIPKLLAAMLIAKAPGLYGFHDLNFQQPYRYDYFNVPGGTDLYNLAHFLKIGSSQLVHLNPELVKGFVPPFVHSHRIRVPKGLVPKVSEFVRASL